ncbi:TrkH family potassium uptake protein [Phosphitispora fastidiosa]|uniref:TrkH family potassium uptake protein n=1 Tax=Phosphitispora fastidiosa TaxID=2837202 RepID=UPI001E4F184D|nr:TrkH family potassium uptake protein [Phosphitispora fastidiosa]MBU7007204.1 trk system potassium uptake protein TrkH [Phosphitispora fastidiosa]
MKTKIKGSIFNRFTPSQILVTGFAGLILFGAVLLSLPLSSAAGEPTNFIDALFTATSAVCVTGLVVVDTGTYYSTFGQIVILLLIQIGGLGFMTMGTLFALLLGKRISLRERLVMKEAYNKMSIEGVVRLAKAVLAITFLIEGIAALILGFRFAGEFGLARGMYYGLFHSVSAFNNAGFDLLGDFRSLTGFTSDIPVNLVISVLVILGGLGFSVAVDILSKRKWRAFSLHTKIVISTTAILLAAGMAGVFLLEFNNAATMKGLPLQAKLMASWFQGMTPRTAGFNTLDIAGLRNATQFLIIIFMFIGASPGSTGGGVKTSTFAALVMAVIAMVRGKEDVEMFGRRLPRDIVQRSLTIIASSIVFVILITMLLTITEQAEFLAVLFEATSAFGTVGLSMGLTAKLTLLGKLVIIFTMYAGRLGPLTIAFALAQRSRKALYHLAEEKIMVG